MSYNFGRVKIAVPLIALLLACCTHTSSAQKLLPKYVVMTSLDSPFASYTAPIGLAILKFEGANTVEVQLFNALKREPVVLNRFTIFPYDVLKTQMEILNLTTLDPNSSNVRQQLSDQLNVSLIVTGKSVGTDGFELRILTAAGKEIYDCTYMNTTKSTAIDDAVKLFKSNTRTEYYKESKWQELGNIEWIPVAGGSFQMGNNNSYSDEKPVHAVTVGSFYMSTTEVTFEQYDKFCEATGGNKLGDNGWGRGSMPVFNSSWDDANAYCKWVSDQAGKTVHLPTEAEYEFAARGGNLSKGFQYSGSSDIDSVAWFDGNSGGRPHDVGIKLPNELGLYDLSGNVWEWCLDWYHETYDGAPSDGSAWNVMDETKPYHVVRAGSWDSQAHNCYLTVRNDANPAGWVNEAGFRLVREEK